MSSLPVFPPASYGESHWRIDPAPKRAPVYEARGVVIHHTAGPTPEPNQGKVRELARQADVIRSIYRMHVYEHGWHDIGYNFFVSRSGHIWECRSGSLAAAMQGKVRQGAHAGDTDHNHHWWGVVLEGNYADTGNVPRGEQWDALIRLVGWLHYRGGTQTADTIGHSDCKSTMCPGSHVYVRLPDLRVAAHQEKERLLAKAKAQGTLDLG